MEKIKLFVKKKEENDDRKLIERIGDWVTDMDNFPLVTYGIGLGVGLGCGYLIGKRAQLAKDVKEITKFKNFVADSFINMNSDIKIDPVISKFGKVALAIQGYNVNDDIIGFTMAAETDLARDLANNLLSVVDKVDPPVTEVSAEEIVKIV